MQIFYSDDRRTSSVVEERSNGTLGRTSERVPTRGLSQIPPEKRNSLINTDAAFFQEAEAVRIAYLCSCLFLSFALLLSCTMLALDMMFLSGSSKHA